MDQYLEAPQSELNVDADIAAFQAVHQARQKPFIDITIHVGTFLKPSSPRSLLKSSFLTATFFLPPPVNFTLPAVLLYAGVRMYLYMDRLEQRTKDLLHSEHVLMANIAYKIADHFNHKKDGAVLADHFARNVADRMIEKDAGLADTIAHYTLNALRYKSAPNNVV